MALVCRWFAPAIACFWLAGFSMATAQELAALPRSSILTLDSESVFSGSSLGRKIADEIETLGTDLAAENRQIEAALIEEEKALTEQRSTLASEEFRALAEAFDTKVQRIRAEQAEKARDLGAREDAARRRFLDAARPVLEQVMRETGAVLIVEQRNVFMSAASIDVTEALIERIDAALAGQDAPPPETGQEVPVAPETSVPATPPKD